jgi:hypothetical protein
MNQDNQVGWEEDLKDGQLVLWADLVRAGLFDKALENAVHFISQVSKDFYAEGMRRAREKVAKLKCDCGGKEDCKFHDFLIEAFNAFDQLEEEVKK